MKTKEMASPPGMELHGSTWRINKRIPVDLLPHYHPKKVLKHPTGETDPRLAASIAWRWLADIDAEFQRVRATGSRLPQTLTDSEADAIIAQMIHSRMGADEEMLVGGVYVDEAGHQRRLAKLEESEAATRQVLARGVATGVIAAAAADWLGAYDIPSDSPEFRRFLLRFAKASAEVHKAQRSRIDGQWVDTPPPPAADPKPAPAEPVLTLSAVVAAFMSKQDKEAAMYKKYDITLSLLLDVVGDKAVSTLKQKDIDGFFELLCRLPPRWADEKRKRGLPPVDLAKLEWPAVISPKTFKDGYLSSLKPFLRDTKRLFGDEGFPPHLTADGIKYSGTQKGGEKKQRAMTLAELKRLFEGSEMAEFAATKAHCYLNRPGVSRRLSGFSQSAIGIIA